MMVAGGCAGIDSHAKTVINSRDSRKLVRLSLSGKLGQLGLPNCVQNWESPSGRCCGTSRVWNVLGSASCRKPETGDNLS